MSYIYLNVHVTIPYRYVTAFKKAAVILSVNTNWNNVTLSDNEVVKVIRLSF